MSITIFLADSHGILRDGLRAFLQGEPDIEVVGDAANGLDAVQQIARLQPDVAVLEIVLPGLGGIEVVQQLRTVSPDTRVLILSTQTAHDTVYHALHAGACGYLLKEASGRELATAIRTVWADERYLHPKIANQLIDDHLRRPQSPEHAKPWRYLTSSEQGVLQLVVEGKTTRQIAQILSLSPHKVEKHRSRLMQKLGTNTLPILVNATATQGLALPEL
jgi:two-component system, NarL family, response regulator NreC